MSPLLITCPHCSHDVYVPPNVQTNCPRCKKPVIAEEAPQAQAVPQHVVQGPPNSQIALVVVLLLILGWITWNEWTRPDTTPRPPSDYVPAATPAVQPSLWDGSVSAAKRFVEKSVRDPSSIKYHEWKNFSAGSRHITTADITATNGFGGPTRSKWVFSFDNSSGALKTVLVDGKMILDQ